MIFSHIRHHHGDCRRSRCINFLRATTNICKSARRRTMSSLSNTKMKSTLNGQLWNPSLGIRFGPKQEPSPLYPLLRFSRFFQSNAIGIESDASRHPPSFLNAKEAIHPQRPSTGKGTWEPSAVPYVSTRENTSKVEDLPVLPQTELPFNASPALYHTAFHSPEKSPGSYWSHTLYEGVNEDGTSQRVKVHYCTSRHTMERVCKKYFVDELVLGFDLEWLAYARKGSGARDNVSLIQMASPGHIGLFHVAVFEKEGDFVAPTFKEIMENPNVKKVGVHIQADCTRVRNYLGVQSKGIFELSHLFKVVKYTGKQQRLINKVPVALATQVQEILGLPMYKEPSVRSSNWNKALNEAQLKYSAADAYAGLQLYYVLEQSRLELDPTPPRPYNTELGLPIPILEVQSGDEESSESDVESLSDSESGQENAPKKKTEPAKMEPSNRDGRILKAEAQAAAYRSSKKSAVYARPAALRAYYLWHHNADLSPKAIASLLRDPPLQLNTVVTYILDTIASEKLPYDINRAKGELFDSMTVISPRYTDIAQTCNIHSITS